MTTADDATLRALIEGERALRDGLDRADEHRYYGIRYDPQELAQHDFDKGWRPHHYETLLRLREHAIAIRSPIVHWGPEYVREFPWWPRSVTFDRWADAQTLTRTRTQTGARLKRRTKDLSGEYDHQARVYREWSVDHGISMVTLLVCMPARQAAFFDSVRRFDDPAYDFRPSAGFTPDYTERLGSGPASLVWAAGIPLAEALSTEPDRTALWALAALRGYRFPTSASA